MRNSALTLAAIAAVLFWARRSYAEDEPLPIPLFDDEIDGSGFWYPIPEILIEGDDMQTSRRLGAFLYMIQRAEHAPQRVASGDAYRTFYGNTLFDDMSDHPVNTGEKTGVKLPDEYCKAAGFSSGCVSTAAGAYQFTRPTWDRIREKAPRLPDFSPSSQDAAAIRLLAERGAVELIEADNIQSAIYRVSSQWASLPRLYGSSKQPTRSIDAVMAFYADGLTRV